MFVILSVGFTACGDDDDDDGVSADKLVGTWELYWNAGYQKSNGEEDRWDEAVTEADKEKITFKADGTGVNDDNESCTWKLDGKKLTITSGGESETVTLLKLNSAELIVEYFEKGTDEDGTYEYYDKFTYKKIK